MVLTLPYHPPLAYQALLRFLEARAIAGVEVVTGETYLRSIAVEQAGRRVHGVIELAPGARHALTLTIHGDAREHGELVAARVRRLFDLDAEPTRIAKVLRRDPLLRPLVQANPGLRVPGSWDGFELAMRGIIGQQITVVGATRMMGQLTAQLGEPLSLHVHDALTHVFPSPAQVRGADLSRLGMPGARRAALLGVAARAADDPTLFAPGQGLDAAVTRLRALPGIGEWTAQYIAMRALAEPDAFLAADVGLHRALTRGDGTRPTARELGAMAEAWRPYRAYAALHLWTSLGAPAAAGKKNRP